MSGPFDELPPPPAALAGAFSFRGVIFLRRLGQPMIGRDGKDARI
jgi:hypothetical protein